MASLKERLQAEIDRANTTTNKTDITVHDAVGSLIDGYGTGGVIAHADIPNYVKNEALEVAKKVKSVQTDNSITFIAVSDAHNLDGNADIHSGLVHAGMGAKILSYALNLDFAFHGGDATSGSNTTTIAGGKAEIVEVNKYIDEAFEGIQNFRTVGNHDALRYSETQNGTVLSDAELFQYFGAYNDGAIYGSETVGYCYKDFTDKKVRVICLNTSESSKENVSDTQKLWFANTLIEVGSKTDWKVIILSHHPLDWGAIIGCSNIVYQYTIGGSYNIGGTTVSFSGKNNAKIIAQFHGHVHCFKVDKLHYNNSGTGVAYDVKRVATPNVCFSRNNEYGENGATEYYGIEFGEDTTYPKTANTSKDTAFCVNVVDLDKETIYSYCYGAGYDREIFYGIESIAVQGITLSATSGILNPNGTVVLTATVTPTDASNKNIIWSTSDPSVATVTNGTVTAIAVGTAKITAKTEDGGYTATYLLTVERAKKGNLISSIGYTDGVRLSTSNGSEKTDNGYVSTGFIDLWTDVTYPAVVRIKSPNCDWYKTDRPYRDSAHCTYDASQTFASSTYNNGSVATGLGTDATCIFSDDNHVIEFTIPTKHNRYLRVCGYGTGAGMDIRINEDFD